MVEIVPDAVDSAFLYFHTAGSSGDEILPFAEELKRSLPSTYIWAGDGPIGGSPFMQSGLTYGEGPSWYWFAFPMQDTGVQSFQQNIEPMGAVLVSCGAYVNRLADELMQRYRVPASRTVLCGHQHGSCVALSASMIRRKDPYSLTILFDPFPLETYYLRTESMPPQTQVVCIDNPWSRDRNETMVHEKVENMFESYGIRTTAVPLQDGRSKPDRLMFRAAAKYVKEIL